MELTVATFNVNGIRARLDLTLGWLQEAAVDILLLQETKCQDKDFPLAAFEEAGFHAAIWGQKAYNGVALISRQEPDEVLRGLYGEENEQARFIAGRWDELWVVNTYVPQGREVGSQAFEHKLDFLSTLHAWLEENFSPEEPLLWAGDINIAPADIDVYDPKRLTGSVGCHPQERAALAELTGWGLSDLYRLHHPDNKQFTFWDYRLPKSFQRGLGWRLDHIYASGPMAGACLDAWVDTAPRTLPKPSDHTPMLARFEL